jgi:hypothetical protein
MAVTVAEGFGIAAIIGGLWGSAFLICLMAALLFSVHRISKVIELIRLRA